MKKIIISIIIGSFIIPVLTKAQQKQGFEITGHLEGIKDGEYVVLGNRFKDWHYLTTIDSCIIKGGNFHLKGGSVSEGPREYELLFNRSSHRRTNPNQAQSVNIGGTDMHFLIQNGEQITITGGDINQMLIGDFTADVSIKGSPGTTARVSLLAVGNFYRGRYEKLDNRFEKIRDSIGYDPVAVQKVIEAKDALDRKLDTILMLKTPVAYRVALPWLMANSLYERHYFFLKDIYNSLDDSLKNSFDGKRLKLLSDVAIGQPFPDFSLESANGTPIKLKEQVGKSKFTILHLWGTNSYHRDQYQQELLTMYKKYHDKGLNVVAMSADTSKDDWQFIVHQKKYPWTNVIAEPKGWIEGSMINDVYNEGGHTMPNTTNILLDDKGKIIAWDVNGPELQWFLWKYLGD